MYLAIIGLIKSTKDGHFIWSFYKNEEFNIETDQDNITNNPININENSHENDEPINIITSNDNPSELNSIYSIRKYIFHNIKFYLNINY